VFLTKHHSAEDDWFSGGRGKGDDCLRDYCAALSFGGGSVETSFPFRGPSAARVSIPSSIILSGPWTPEIRGCGPEVIIGHLRRSFTFFRLSFGMHLRRRAAEGARFAAKGETCVGHRCNEGRKRKGKS